MLKPPPILHDHLMRRAVINVMLLLLECLRHEAVVTINTLWLVVFLPVNVSFWFPAWEAKQKLYSTGDTGIQQLVGLSFTFTLLLIVSYCLVRNTSGADECEIKQSGLSAGFVEVESEPVVLGTCYLHS